MLEQVNYSMAWLKHQEANKRRQEEALERKRVSYAQVDWHNFVVVEKHIFCEEFYLQHLVANWDPDWSFRKQDFQQRGRFLGGRVERKIFPLSTGPQVT